MARRFAQKNRKFHRVSVVLLLLAAMLTSTGCNIYGRPQRATTQQVMLDAQCPPEPGRMPAKELAKVTLPAYVIEPPDILLIDALRVVPKPPFRIQSFDTLQVIVEGTLLEQPINGLYVVEPGGMLDLGPSYGKVMVGNLSLEEAQDAVFKHLKRVLKEPQVSLTLAQAAGQQLVTVIAHELEQLRQLLGVVAHEADHRRQPLSLLPHQVDRTGELRHVERETELLEHVVEHARSVPTGATVTSRSRVAGPAGRSRMSPRQSPHRPPRPGAT